MDTTDQVHRFMNECALFLAAVKYRGPLTPRHREVVKFKLYELLYAIEAPSSSESSQAKPDWDQSVQG
jgi:hypothetical protein